MTLAALLLLAAFAEPGPSPQAGGAAEPSKQDRVVCKRVEAPMSRMPLKRVCKTAREWKEGEADGTADKDISNDSRMRRN
jgi:hypothetical protein